MLLVFSKYLLKKELTCPLSEGVITNRFDQTLLSYIESAVNVKNMNLSNCTKYEAFL